MKSTLNACMLLIGYIELNILSYTKPSLDSSKNIQLPVAPSMPIQLSTYKLSVRTVADAPTIAASMSATSFTAPATSIPLLQSNSKDKSNPLSVEYLSWEKKWERYYKWVQNNHAVICLIHNTLNTSQ